MKKINLFSLFLTLYLIFVTNINVNAVVMNSELKCYDLKSLTLINDCVTLCKYEYSTYDNSNSLIERHNVHIRYYYGKTLWEAQASKIGSTAAFASNYKSYGTYTYSKLREEIEFISGSFATSTEANFTCPTYAYFDLEGINELCFDDNGTYCTNDDPGGSSTTFDKKAFLKTNFEDELLLKMYDITFFASDISKFVSEGASLDAYIEMKANAILISAGLDEYPGIVNTPAYNEMMNYLNDSVKDAASEYDEEILNDDTLTEEEKEVLLEASKEITEQAAVYLNSLKNHIDNLYDPSDVITDCAELLGKTTDSGTTAYYLQIIFNAMKYIAIVALIVLSTVDYFKAIIEQDPNAFSRINKTVFKRLACCVALFFIPILLNMFLELIGITDSCGIS